MKEWMIHVWGGAWNDDANPSIEKDYGIKEGYHYFQSENKKNEFLEIINKPEYRHQGIVRDIKYGNLTHCRTIFVGTMRYKDKEFTIHHDFGYEYDPEDVKFMFFEGNYSCDCNISLFIRREYGEDVIPILECGNEIEIVNWHIEYKP